VTTDPDQAAAERDRSLHRLSASQALAVDALDGGMTHGEAAAVAGVDRTTVSRWATKHPGFVAELNRRKAERSEKHARRIDEVTLLAIDVIAASLAEGNTTLAVKWLGLRGFAALTTAPDGPTDSRTFIERRRAQIPTIADMRLEDLTGAVTIENAYAVIYHECEGGLDGT